MSSRELTIEARVENTTAVQAFVEEALDEAGCPMKAGMQIAVAVEEVFVNIAQYAYAPATGEAELRVTASAGSAAIRFADRGRPYDPLAKEDPDVALPAEERPIGGLGIFMTKKLMDELHYEYRDGQNVLTLIKTW